MVSKVSSEDLFETLRVELSLIASQIEDLRVNLSSPDVRSLSPSDAGIAFLRLDALEAKLRSTVGRVEALEFNLKILSKDAEHRLAEFYAKLEAIEEKKKILKIKTLSASDESLSSEKFSDVSNETLRFDEALLQYTSGDFESALTGFESFNELYPKTVWLIQP